MYISYFFSQLSFVDFLSLSLFFQDWALRSEEQSLLIERILVLMRNVLQVPANPEAECRADNDASVHDQVIWALQQSGILDLVLFIIASPDEQQFHLHCLEILCLLYREQVSSLEFSSHFSLSVIEHHILLVISGYSHITIACRVLLHLINCVC